MPRARLVDVAARAGVSTATASLVLRRLPGPSALSQQAVRDAARSLGYRPDRAASMLARQRTQLLGVLLDVTSPFHAELVVALDAAAGERGFELLLATTTPRRGEQVAFETLVDSRCEGIVLLGPEMGARSVDRLAASCPIFCVGRGPTRLASGVRADDERGLRLAVDHLVGLGHTRIAYVDGPGGPISTSRRRGYRHAMRRHRLTVVERVTAGGNTEVAGIAAATELLESPADGIPTAIIAFNDRVAIGLLDAAERAGLDAPADLSVVGYDDSPLARLAHVGLTTVSQDPPALAAAVVEVAADRLGAGASSPPVEVVVAPQFVVRSTTGPAPPTGVPMGVRKPL